MPVSLLQVSSDNGVCQPPKFEYWRRVERPSSYRAVPEPLACGDVLARPTLVNEVAQARQAHRRGATMSYQAVGSRPDAVVELGQGGGGVRQRRSDGLKTVVLVVGSGSYPWSQEKRMDAAAKTAREQAVSIRLWAWVVVQVKVKRSCRTTPIGQPGPCRGPQPHDFPSRRTHIARIDKFETLSAM
jgi:hypothetical protein